MRFRSNTAAAVILLTCSLLESTSVAQSFRNSPNSARQPNVARRGNPTVANFKTTRAPVESENFVVYADSTQLANKVSREAERFRKELAVEWLGKELPAWGQKCPITVKVEMHAGGETSFAFMPDQTGRSQPIDWRMKIFGPADRLLDAVLPHEITHTIFATHFGRPLPRWADEGACTTVEHISERRKNHQMLMQFLSAQPSRGIPFNRMFTMRNYPNDILPLYAQGYSLARYLIQQKGRRHFLNYVSKGLENENRTQVLRAWDTATNEFYGFDDLSDLQVEWLKWVKDGSPDNLPNRNPATAIASLKRPQANSNKAHQLANNSVQQASFTEVESTPNWSSSESTYANADDESGSWYKRQMKANIKVAGNQGLTKTRKASSKPTHILDSRLPQSPATIWR